MVVVWFRLLSGDNALEVSRAGIYYAIVHE